MTKTFYNHVLNNDFCKRDYDDKIIESIILQDNDLEKVFSLNKTKSNAKLIENATKIIVGTLTSPKGMQNGYYYTSCTRNVVFNTLDEAFDENGKFAKLKKDLSLSPNNKQIINQIESKLFDFKIAFIDVINQAIRTKNSPNDSDIFMYSLDLNAFKHCNKNQIFICTSKNAKLCLEKIVKNNNLSIDLTNVFLCQQDRFHFNKQLWLDLLKK